MIRAIIALAMLPCLAACTTTNTTPLAPDVFRLDTSASGLLFTSNAGADTILRAAQITQSRGFSHFAILDSASASGSTVTGGAINRVGGTWIASTNRTPTQNVSVVVQMMNQAAPGAWSVAEVIAKNGRMF